MNATPASAGPAADSAAGPTHAPTLACERCLESHVAFAAVLAQEVAEDSSRLVERRLALGNLKAAEWHARALGRPVLASRLRAARHALSGGDVAPAAALLADPLTDPAAAAGPAADF